MSCNFGRWRALSPEQRDRWRQRTPPCCSWDSASYADKNCARDVGSLVRAAFETGSGRFFSAAPRALVPVGGNGCACNASREPLLSMQWESAPGCSLRRWSAKSFCRALGARRLLFLGDSVMQQLAAVAMNAVAWDDGGCSHQLVFGASDTLINARMGASNRGEHWLRWVDAVAPDVVVLGATAHVYGDANFSRVLEEVARDARARPALTVIWATSTPGGCGKAPLATLHRGVDRSAFFNWGEFLARDAVAKAFFARQGAQFRVLDLEPLHYRQDAHVAEDDCLHLCIPGPLNAIVPPLLTRVLGGFRSV